MITFRKSYPDEKYSGTSPPNLPTVPTSAVVNYHVLSDFINLTQVHNFTVSAQDVFTFRRLSVFTVSFTRILQVLIQIMKPFALYY